MFALHRFILLTRLGTVFARGTSFSSRPLATRTQAAKAAKKGFSMFFSLLIASLGVLCVSARECFCSFSSLVTASRLWTLDFGRWASSYDSPLTTYHSPFSARPSSPLHVFARGTSFSSRPFVAFTQAAEVSRHQDRQGIFVFTLRVSVSPSCFVAASLQFSER